MKAVAYSIKSCEKELLIKANEKKHEITMISNRLSPETIAYAEGKDAVLVFSCDDVSAPILQKLKEYGVKYISTRSTGTDHIDLEMAARLDIRVGNIPTYSPESIAEHAMMLILALCRRVIPAHRQMMEFDFSVDQLVGTTIHNKTVGIVGFGHTGMALAAILRGFGARVVTCDTRDVSADCSRTGAVQVPYDELLAVSDIISYHVPLTEATRHMVDAASIARMKDGVMLINVSRGAVFHSEEVLDALQSGKISQLGMDVYEFEHDVFFHDHSRKPVRDPLLKSFIQHSRVLLTPHIAFATREALKVIAEQTIRNLDLWNARKCVGPACQCLDASAVPNPHKLHTT